MRSLTYEKAKLCPKHRGVLPEAMRYFANGGRKEKKNEKKNAFSFGNSNKSRIFAPTIEKRWRDSSAG